MTRADQVLKLLQDAAETDKVRKNPDLPLYDLQVLDSMRTAGLIVAISQEFGIGITPAELDREPWGTPRKLVSARSRQPWQPGIR